MIQTWFDPEEIHLFSKNAQLFPIFINISNVQTKKENFLSLNIIKLYLPDFGGGATIDGKLGVGGATCP